MFFHSTKSRVKNPFLCCCKSVSDTCSVVLFSQPIGLAVLHLRESGALATLQKKWWQDKGECVGDEQKVIIFTITASIITINNTTTIIIIIVS